MVFKNKLFLLFHVRLFQRSPLHAFNNVYRNQTLFYFLFLGPWYKWGHNCIQLHVSALQAHCPDPLWVTGKPCSLKAHCPIAWTSVPREIVLFLLQHNHQSYSNYLHFSVTNCLVLFYPIFNSLCSVFSISLLAHSFLLLLPSFRIPCQDSQWFITHHDCCAILLPPMQTTSVSKVIKCK